jgi:hypothetical protein
MGIKETGAQGQGETVGVDDFRSSEAEKKAAAQYIEKHLRPETHKAGNSADDETKHVTGGRSELHKWQLTSGLMHRHSRWERHLRKLKNRLEQEQAGLQQANRLIGFNDQLTGQRIGDANVLVPPNGSPLTTPTLRSRLDDY